MKTRNLNIYILLLGMAMALFACQPDEFSLGSLLSKEDLEYSITQNADDPNMVILESQTPGFTPLWVTPTGRSTKLIDTLRFPFAGDYKFVYGVQSNGGFVQADTFNLSITTNNFNYVDDPLWTMLTGGVGQSKTWVLDLFTQDVAPNYSKYFVGPQYFWGTEDTWKSFHLLADGISREEVNAQLGIEDGWNWDADWAGNGSWLFGGEPAQDYGTMTFDLIDGPHLIVDHLVSGIQESGTYTFDADAKTMRTTDATIVHPPALEGQVSDWTDITVLNLTENTLQLGVIRTEGDPAMLLFNFISKEYSDNWVAPDLPDPEPPYNGNANEDLTTATSTTKTWKIDLDIPYNWHGLDGTALNEVATTTSEGGFAFTTWTPPYDDAAFSAVSMTLTKEDDNGGTYKIKTLSNSYEGTYSVDENNNIDFGQPITFFSGVGGWLTFGTTAENSLRIILSEKDALGNIEGIWLGQRSSEKDEYISLHMVPVSGGGEVDPLAVWKNALKGKTLVPDVNYFADWYSADWSGGWTSGLYPDDFESQSWFWTEEVYNACLASSISFYVDGDVLKADAIDNGTAKNGIIVDIDPEKATLNFSEAPFTYTWIFTNNNEGKGPWLAGSRDGASLNNISEKGLYLGFYSKFDDTNTEVPIEITGFHMVIGN